MGVCFPSPEYCMLVLVDAQDRLCGVMSDLDERLPAMRRALELAALLEVDLVVTEQYPEGLGPTHAQLREVLPESVVPITKKVFSCWGAAEFRRTVEATRPQALVLIGMETHVCVQQTAVAALVRGCGVIVAADAVCSRHALDRDTALAHMRARGAMITTVESLGFDWLETASHAAFKAAVRIVK